MKFSRDIWFNAFLISKGFEILKYDVDNRKKVTCHFNLDDDKWKELRLEFQKSDISKFKTYLDQIKELGY